MITEAPDEHQSIQVVDWHGVVRSFLFEAAPKVRKNRFMWVCLNLWAGQALGTDDQDDQAGVGNNNRTETCRSYVRDHPTTGDAIS